MAFAVRDTGVGIAAHQQEVIFEAFRQADGSIHRKFGGTGLGLSISRDLAALLGGAITVQSELGEGSVFTLTLPPAFNAGTPARRKQPALQGPSRDAARQAPSSAASAASRRSTEDDRDAITPGGRVILLVEDDPAFAMILRDLVREMGFQCVAAASANEGLIAAAQYLPSAILLDVNLPDHSGLGVLDSLKRDPRTRHIPGSHDLGLRLQARGVGARRHRLCVEAGEARGVGRGAAAPGSQVLAKRAAGADRRGRSAAAGKHAAIAEQRRRADHRGGERGRSAGASQGHHVRLHGGGSQPAGFERLRSAGKNVAAGRRGISAGHHLHGPRA